MGCKYRNKYIKYYFSHLLVILLFLPFYFPFQNLFCHCKRTTKTQEAKGYMAMSENRDDGAEERKKSKKKTANMTDLFFCFYRFSSLYESHLMYVLLLLFFSLYSVVQISSGVHVFML